MADELYLISGSTLTDIGDAIRGAKGTTAKIQVGNYASEIRNNIPTYHTVTFKGLDGETLATYQVKHGEGVAYTGVTPTGSSGNYFFEKWDTDTTTITQNTVVNAIKADKWSVAGALSYDQGNYAPSYYCQIIGSQRQEHAIVPAELYDGKAVQSITTGVFGDSLKTIVIGIHVKPDTRAFNNCINLQDVYYLGNKSQWFNTVRLSFSGSSSTVQEGNSYFWLAPRIHTTDGCIISS